MNRNSKRKKKQNVGQNIVAVGEVNAEITVRVTRHLLFEEDFMEMQSNEPQWLKIERWTEYRGSR